MKRLILLLLMSMVLAFAASPPEASAQITTTKTQSDTLTNADTTTLTVPSVMDKESVNLQVLVKRLSGTLAGSVYLYRSNDNVNFELYDSLTLSNAAAVSKHFTITQPAPVYTKAVFITSGTVTARSYLVITRRRH
jgi:hypothetical protein